MTVTMSLETIRTRTLDVPATDVATQAFTTVALCDTPDSLNGEVLFFVRPETAAAALAIADAFRAAALKYLPAPAPANEAVLA